MKSTARAEVWHIGVCGPSGMEGINSASPNICYTTVVPGFMVSKQRHSGSLLPSIV